MKGRPGVLTITTADGVSATHAPRRRRAGDRRAARAQARAARTVTLDAGARQLVRMTLRPAAGRRPGPARPPARDRRAEGRRLRRRRLPDRHRQDDHHRPRARAPRRHHAAGFRALVVAEGRLLGQWRDELTARRARPRPAAAGARTSRCSCSTTRGRSPGRSARFDRALGDRARRRARAQRRCSTATRPSCRRSPGTC